MCVCTNCDWGVRVSIGAGELDGSIGEGSDEYLGYLFTQVQNRRVKAFTPALEALGLSTPLWRAMSTINRLDGCLMSELAEFTTTDRTTLTRTVDQLVEAGLARRGALAEDRRLVRVELTEKGREIFARAVEALESHNRTALTGFSPPELKQLRMLLQRKLRNVVADDDLFAQVLHFRS